MRRSPIKVDIFGLGLLIRRGAEGYHARGVFRGHGIQASITSLVTLTAGNLEDLAGQIERQYGDFDAPVVWASADGAVSVRWDLDELGHAVGRIVLRDLLGDWTLEAALTGDQSYLPQMALGLRLLLRGQDGC